MNLNCKLTAEEELIERIEGGFLSGKDVDTSAITSRVLECAIRHGNLDAVKTVVLRNNDNINKNELVSTAIQHGRIEIVKYLVNEVNIQPIIAHYLKAAEEGHLEILKYLIGESDIKMLCRPLLMVAAQNGRIGIVKYLIKGCTGIVSSENDFFLLKAIQGGNLEVVKCLIKEGAGNISALQVAVSFNRAEIVEFLITQGYNVNFEHIRMNKSNKVFLENC